MSHTNGAKRGRPSTSSILERAKQLNPIVSAPALANLLEMQPRFIYDVVRTSKIETEGYQADGRAPIPVPIKRAHPRGRLRWFRDDIIKWIEGAA